jgi:hypothetical protein
MAGPAPGTDPARATSPAAPSGPAVIPARPDPLGWGERAPSFRAPTLETRDFAFDTVAGRWQLLAFLGRLDTPDAHAALAALSDWAASADPDHAIGFGFVHHPDDIASARAATRLPAMRFFLDPERALARTFGAVGPDGADRPVLLLLDPQQRGIAQAPVARASELVSRLSGLPPPHRHAGGTVPPPALIVPRIFEPALCRALIDGFEAHGGEDSGFMREVDGQTRMLLDDRHKRRRDWLVDDVELATAVRQRLRSRLLPEMARVFQFHATRIERLLVACYDADSGGWFRPHRDNTTAGTAHRRFACTINLNPADYEGGDLRFPEYGAATLRAPTGGAILFSCSLLHEATSVTRGRRYAFLPFFYDEAAAEIRRANNARLAPEVSHYRG